MARSRNNGETMEDFDDRVLDALQDWQQNYLYSPSVRDLATAVGINSTSAIHRSLARLETAGRIVREHGIARSLRVVPESLEGKG